MDHFVFGQMHVHRIGRAFVGIAVLEKKRHNEYTATDLFCNFGVGQWHKSVFFKNMVIDENTMVCSAVRILHCRDLYYSRFVQERRTTF